MTDSRSIIVTNLPNFTTKEQLEEIFSSIGPVKTCTISKKDSRAAGLITFATEEDAAEALSKPLKLGKIPLKPVAAADAANILPKHKLFKIKHNKEHREKQKGQKGKIIIKNMPYKVTSEQLKKVFKQFGPIRLVNLPQKNDGTNRGFGFVLFEETKSAIKAINKYNGSELFGRTVTVDMAMSKDKYISLQKQASHPTTTGSSPTKSQSESEEEESDKESEEKESEEEENEEVTVKSEEGKDEASADSEEDEESGEDEKSEEEKDEEQEEKVNKNRWRNSDVEEGRTLFLRNISFDVTQEMLKTEFSKFGPLRYSVLCYDKTTQLPKGTGFVQFVKKEDAESCLNRLKAQPLYLDGRQLEAMWAKPRTEISAEKSEAQQKTKKKKDNRNLALLREGNVVYSKNDGISKSDQELRTKIVQERKAAINGSLFKFVSTTRLTVYNIPKQCGHSDLWKIFGWAAGPQAQITEAKVMYHTNQKGSDGKPLSKGFGFVNFTSHEDALKALRAVNNNPSWRPFKPTKRPIVYFSIEDKRVHMAKENYRQKQQKLAQLKQENTTEESQETEKIYTVEIKKRKRPINAPDSRPNKKFKKSGKKKSGQKGKKNKRRH